MTYYLAVAIGGALGAVSRYWMMNVVDSALRPAIQSGSLPGPYSGFPWGTLTVNVVGSLLIGILFVLLTERWPVPAEWRGILIVGYVGAFTTFSTFSLDALQLFLQGQVLQATGYILGSVLICILAVWLAIWMTRLLVAPLT